MRYVKILVLFMATSIFLSCKKSIKETAAEKFFNTTILNSNYQITEAENEGVDITGLYSGYRFLLKKGSDYYHGQLIATKGDQTYTGTWESNEDFGKLIISLPATPDEFAFLSRTWRFTSKNIPTLKFAPWGSDAQILLTMKREQ